MELTFTMRLVMLSSKREVSRKGAITLTAQVSSYPSSDFCRIKKESLDQTHSSFQQGRAVQCSTRETSIHELITNWV